MKVATCLDAEPQIIGTMNATKIARRVRSASPFRRAPTASELIEQIRRQEMEKRRHGERHSSFREPRYVDPSFTVKRVDRTTPYYYRDRSDSAFMNDPYTAKLNSLSRGSRGSSEPPVDRRNRRPQKKEYSHPGHDLETLSTASSSERDSQEAALREVVKRKAFRDRFMKPKQQQRQSAKIEEKKEDPYKSAEPRRGRSRSLRRVLSGRSDRLHADGNEEADLVAAMPGGNHSADQLALSKRDKKLDESRLKKKMKERAKRNRSQSKMALSLIGCANKAQDYEYEEFLARQQEHYPLEYEVIADFDGSNIQTQVESGPMVKSASFNTRQAERNPSSIDVVTVRRSHSFRHTISELTGPIGHTAVTDKVLQEHDIRSIRDTLSQIERNLKDAARRGQKVSRSEMVQSLSSVASSLDITVDQLLSGKIVKSQAAYPFRMDTIESRPCSPDDAHGRDGQQELDADVSPSKRRSPPQERVASCNESNSTGNARGGEKDVDDNDDASVSEGSEFTKWAHELEDDDSREAENFMRELFSSLSAISQTMSASRARTADAAFVPVQSNVSNASRFVRTDRASNVNESVTITRRAVSFKENDHMSTSTFDPDVLSTDPVRPTSPITFASSVHLNSYDNGTENRMKPRRARSWQRISQGVTSPLPRKAEQRHSQQHGNRTDASIKSRDKTNDGSWSESSDTDSEFDESTVHPETDGFNGAMHDACRPLFQNPYLSMEAVCGSLDNLVSGVQRVKIGAFYR